MLRRSLSGGPSPFSERLLRRRGFSDIARDLSSVLRNPPGGATLEAALTRAAAAAGGGKLLPAAAVEAVLRQSPAATPCEQSSLLRFFVWAGLHPSYRHSAAAFALAADSLDLPAAVPRLFQSYKADRVPAPAKAFKLVLNLCRRGGAGGAALQTLRAMPEFGCLPDTACFNPVLLLLARAGDAARAADLVREMARAGSAPDLTSLVALVQALCRGGRFPEARAMAASFPAPNVVLFSALLDGACQKGDLGSAMAILGEMESGSLGELCAPNAVTYTCLMKCLVGKGMMGSAVGLLARMEKRGCGPNRVTLATLLRGLCERKMLAEAFALAAGAGEEACGSLVLALVRAGDLARAEELVRAMLDRGRAPDGAATNALLREIIGSGSVDRGIRWVERMWAAGLTLDPDVYSSLVDLAVREGRLTEAAGLVSRLRRLRVPLPPPVDLDVELST